MNREWIFSGIGVSILIFLIRLLRRKRNALSQDVIITHGPQSPGKVGRDYKVTIHEKENPKN